MSRDLDDLYQSVILDHNKTPRNFHELPPPASHADGHNPLCGDRLTVWVDLEDDTVKDVAFLGNGCAISKASASMMTAAVKGKSRADAMALADEFQKLVTGKLEGRGRTEGPRQTAGAGRRLRVSGPRQVRQPGVAYAQGGDRRRGGTDFDRIAPGPVGPVQLNHGETSVCRIQNRWWPRCGPR